MVAPVFPPPGHPALFIKVDFLSFLGHLCVTRKEVTFRSATCSLASDPGTSDPSGGQVGLGYIHIISGVGLQFSCLILHD